MGLAQVGMGVRVVSQINKHRHSRNMSSEGHCCILHHTQELFNKLLICHQIVLNVRGIIFTYAAGSAMSFDAYQTNML